MATYDLTSSIPAASSLAADDILNCAYTGSEISIQLAAGRYKIEAYGAAGATNARATSVLGGEGGHSYGTISFEDDTIIYLNAGGTGGSGGSSSSTKNAEGYNGGGYAYYYAGSGGGASHVATASGLLASLSGNTDAIIIVAGGGGGSSAYSTSSSSTSYRGAGGKGGGEKGEHGYYGSSNASSNALKYGGSGGTQSSGGAAGTSTSRTGSAGSFGQGGNGGTASSSYYGEGGGGGGYYGGGGGSGYEAGGGGGSGYLSSSLTDSLTEQGGNTGNGYITITVIEIYSKTHTITFYDGTAAIGSVETGGNESIALPAAPAKDGYKFLGYYLSDGTTQITQSSYESRKLTEDIACYAKYGKYSIEFVSNGASYYTVSTTGKETIAFPSNPALDGYQFIEWQLNGSTFDQAYLDSRYLTSDIQVTALFRQKFAVSFICDGTTYKTCSSAGCESIAAPTAIPSKDGYTFEGWFVDQSYSTAYTEDYFSGRIISADTAIYGKLTEDCPSDPGFDSKVIFYANGSEYSTITTRGHETLTLPAGPSVDGYKFGGWFLDQGYSIPFSADYLANRWINKDISVYAKLTDIIKYDVTFMLNGRKYYATKSAGNETLKTPSDPKISNYEFEGWYWDSSFSDPYDASRYASAELTQALTVYGKLRYTKKNDITFYLSATAAEAYATISTTGGETLTMPSDPTPDLGYDFKGWFLDKKLTVSFEPDYYSTHYLTKPISVYAGFAASANGPYSLEVRHDGTGATSPDVGTYTIAKGTTTTITVTPTSDNFKYLEVNGESVDVIEADPITTPENAVAYFPFDDTSDDSFGRSTATASGTPAINTATLKFGAGSMYFGGSAALKIDLPESFSDQFTVELWFYTSGSATSGYYPCLFSTDGSSDYGNVYFAINDGSYSDYPVCRANSATGGNNGAYGSTEITAGAWHHFAYCRDGSSNYYFLDGELIATVTQSSPQEVSAVVLGCLYRNASTSYLSTDYFTGYVDDLLISSGCKHTSSFDVPTAAYDAKATYSYTYDISSQSSNVVATAYFGELQDFTVTSSAEDGTIDPEGETTVRENSSQTYMCKGDSGQDLKAFLVDGVAVETTKTGTYSYDDAICLMDFDSDEIVDRTGKCEITQSGSPKISSDQAKFGSSSLHLNGSSYLHIALPSTYSDGFTMECWFYCTSSNASGSYPTPICWGQGSSLGQTYFHMDDGSYSTYAVCRSNLSTSSSANGGYDSTSTAITRNEWHHLVVSRTTSYCYFFVDGTLRKTVTNSSPAAVSEVDVGALVGSSVDSNTYFTGYIDEVVIYPSTKRTSAFTPPTEAYEATLSDVTYSYTLKNFHSDKTVRAIFSPLLYLKIGSDWKGIAKVYKRVSGAWVEQASGDLAGLFSTAENYAQGVYSPDSASGG